MSELQTAITNLQLKHSELVAAVKSYPGTVASAANAALGEASVEQRKARDTVQNLRNQIENDGQSLILDWEYDVAVVNGEGKLLSEEVEFSRSTGGGRFNAQGQYEWVEAGVPRIDYDPVTGECLGLLVEEQSTNLCIQSENLSEWSSPQGCTLDSGDIPTRFLVKGSMDRLTAISDGSTDRRLRIGFAASAIQPESTDTACMSAVFWMGGGCTTMAVGLMQSFTRFSFVAFDTSTMTGSVHTASAAASGTFLSAENLGGGFWKLNAKFTFGGGYAVYPVIHFGNGTAAQLRNSPAQTGSIGVGGVQLTLNTHRVVSYIPTNGAAVTRAADNLFVDLADEFGPAGVTAVVETISLREDGAEYGSTGNRITWLDEVLSFGRDSGRDNERVTLSKRRGATDAFYLGGFNRPAGQTSGFGRAFPEGTWMPGVPSKAAFSLHPDTDTLAGAAGGEYITLTGNYGLRGILEAANRITFGRGGPTRGLIICKASLYPRALSESELRELTL